MHISNGQIVALLVMGIIIGIGIASLVAANMAKRRAGAPVYLSSFLKPGEMFKVLDSHSKGTEVHIWVHRPDTVSGSRVVWLLGVGYPDQIQPGFYRYLVTKDLATGYSTEKIQFLGSTEEEAATKMRLAA